ncbi:hypothetical protein BGZ99_010050 [Dissophora globulifera]|uniref:Ion transport domain-containing protein n=1 Tax=Dissophora globulifera TaxID=979702 RepID=A0A9P6RUV7_9FUNG|nr:hypothetical protein BGZ99_010050 [Dissophora globulifera]
MSSDVVVEIPADAQSSFSGLPDAATIHQHLDLSTILDKSVISVESRAERKVLDSQRAYQPSQAALASDRTPPFRMYFGDEVHRSQNECEFRCTTEYRTPVKVDVTCRFTKWRGSITTLKAGLYNIVLGISIENLNVKSIESLSFCNGNSNPNSNGALETLRSFPSSRTGVLRLGLHRQFDKFSVTLKGISMDMEIRTVDLESLQTHPGFIELHYMELHRHQFDTAAEANLILHRPFRWSINVSCRDDTVGIEDRSRPASILHYAVSGDGTHVATLSCTDKYLQMDIWSLKSDQLLAADLHGPEAKNKLDSNPFSPSAPFYPQSRAQVHLPLSAIVLPAREHIMVTMSWDSSKVAVVAANAQYLQEALCLFHYNTALPSTLDGDASKSISRLVPSQDHRNAPALKDFCGYGRFHITAHQDQDVKDELFFSCAKTTVDIYSIHGEWIHLRTIVDDSMCNPRKIIDSLRVKYFSWTSLKGMVYVCDLESGTVTTRITLTRDTLVRFSRDGSQMVLRHTGMKTTTRWTETATVIGTAKNCLGFPAFIQDDSHVIVPSVLPNLDYGRGDVGVVLDATSLIAVRRVSVPIPLHEQQLSSYGADSQSIYSQHGSKLDFVQLDDVVIQPYPRRQYKCNDKCFNELSPLQVFDSRSILQGDSHVSLPSGLSFFLSLRAASTKGWRRSADKLESLVVSIFDVDGRSRESLVIPPTDLGDILGEWLEYRVTFNVTTLQMIVHSHIVIMVWDLPSSVDEEFSLNLAWWTQAAAFQIEDRVDWLWTGVVQCTHGQSYLKWTGSDEYHNEAVVDIVCLRRENPFWSASHEFLEGALVLVQAFEADEDSFRKAVLKYFGRYVNNYPNPENLLENVIARICQNVTQENHLTVAHFLTALFDSPYGRWVPRLDYDEHTNPVSMLLKISKRVPRAVVVAQVIINYCTRLSSLEEDPHFASSLMVPMNELIAQRRTHTELSLGALRRLAFVPVKERSFIVDHHVIAHPPTFSWLFWRPNAKKLYECESPVIELDRTAGTIAHDTDNDLFTRDLYVASFDLLWSASPRPPDLRSADLRSVVERIGASQPQSKSWITAILQIFFLKFRFKSSLAVVPHDFALESLDNPAIAALVEYKWSPYNIIDIVVFTLPLAGSIIQIMNIINQDQNGNTNVLSFSVLFIFLHCLFELRINKNVCQFVTVIIRIMGRIRVFFVVFTAGILAFTIAILHLLRACAVGTCDKAEVVFPSHFFGAFSSTYFFMGGIWDPVSELFGKDNWAFHIMMIVYFFFTTILLLNILIALMNAAFETSDKSWMLVWIENRLHYVHGAENLTYQIPGFRDTHGSFPKEIYYSATLQEVKDYRATYLKNRKESGPGPGEDSAQRLHGQASSAKKMIVAAVGSPLSPSLVRQDSLTPSSEDMVIEKQQQAIQKMTEVQEKTEKRVEELQAQLAEVKELLVRFCKEP